MKMIPLCINAASSVWENTQSAAAPTFFTRAFTCITFVLELKYYWLSFPENETLKVLNS